MPDQAHYPREICLYDPQQNDQKGIDFFSYHHKPKGVEVVDESLVVLLYTRLRVGGTIIDVVSRVTRESERLQGRIDTEDLVVESLKISHCVRDMMFEYRFTQKAQDVWETEDELLLYEKSNFALSMLLLEFKLLEATTPVA